MPSVVRRLARTAAQPHHARTILNAIGYGLATAVLGYLNPALLVVFVAHGRAGPVSAFARPAPRKADVTTRLAGWLAGCAVAALLLIPLAGYVREVGAFSLKHRDFLFLFGEVRC